MKVVKGIVKGKDFFSPVIVDNDRGVATRILLVEDFQPYRSLVALLLKQNPGFHVVGEAEDGMQAVTQAQQLRPDVVLIDIGLPNLNGLEAARHIRSLLPLAKIIFITQVEDVDTVKEAFNVGASGYILKLDTATDLVAALTAVIKGRRFLSRGLSGKQSEFTLDSIS